MDCSPPGSSVHAIPQERILEWVAISYSRESSWPRDGIEPRSPAPPTSVGVFFTTVQCELRVLVKRIIWQLKKLFCYEIKTNVKILKVKKWNLKLLMILSHFSDDSVGKQFRLQCRWASLIPGLERSPGGGNDNPVQYSWPGEFHGQRSLSGYSPWGHKELNTTECVRAHTHIHDPISQW